MIITDVEVKQSDGCVRLSASVIPEMQGVEPHVVWFEFPEEYADMISANGDPFLAGFLIPCMHDGENLRIDAPVSRTLLESTGAAQQVYLDWYPSFMKRIDVVAGTVPRSDPADDQRGILGCFSCGVDSWCTLISHRDEITHLLLIDGFDIALRNRALWDNTLARAKEAADSESKELITARTNLRELTDKSNPKWGTCSPINFWAEISNGSALSATALCLQNGISKLIIPSSYFISHVHPFGSHPLTDPLWSSERLRIVHDSCAITRLEKLAVAATSSVALAGLRVCFDIHLTTELNCCECEKCNRTMMGLRALGVLDQSSAFHKPLNLKRVIGADRPASHTVSWYREVEEEARKHNDTELLGAIAALLGDKPSPVRARARIRRYLVKLGRRFLTRRVLERLDGRQDRS